MLPKLPKESLLEILRKMLLIRHFEESLIGLFDKGHFRGHYHVYIGQEATGVAALSCLGVMNVSRNRQQKAGRRRSAAFCCPS